MTGAVPLFCFAVSWPDFKAAQRRNQICQRCSALRNPQCAVVRLPRLPQSCDLGSRVWRIVLRCDWPVSPLAQRKVPASDTFQLTFLTICRETDCLSTFF